MSFLNVFTFMMLGVFAWEFGKAFANWCFDRRHGGGE